MCTSILLYASPLIWKLHPCGDIIFNYISLPSMAATFLVTCLKVMLELSEYSIFHDGITPVSVSTLKSLLGTIRTIPLKP